MVIAPVVWRVRPDAALMCFVCRLTVTTVNDPERGVLKLTWRGSGDFSTNVSRFRIGTRVAAPVAHAPGDLQMFFTTCGMSIVKVGSMHNVMTSHPTAGETTPGIRSIGPSIYDETFFQLVGDLDTPVDAFQRRALEWARFADRLRSLGASITIGSPS
jgi:hypothetical protein